MEKSEITIEGLVAVIDSNNMPENLKDKAIEVLEYALETAMPIGLKKAQIHKTQEAEKSQ